MSTRPPMLSVTRRGVLAGSLGVALPVAIPFAAAKPAPAPDTRSPRHTATTPPDAVAPTQSGQVRGTLSDGIFTFKGIPYGQADRFAPARPPEPWSGTRAAFAVGPICPQPGGGPGGSDAARYYAGTPERSAQSENCLRINVWTPALTGRRPVLFWIHGGGFETGSAHEGLSYDGEAISRRGDIVVVSINHRLGAFGFLNLAGQGPEFSRSANHGLLDIVLALQWVRDNIAAFGGDAGAITIMGQSGGGRKVSCLLAMPAAAGLFHRAIIHSGSLIGVPTPQETAPLAAATLELLGGLEAARTAPPAKLVEALLTARRRFLKPGGTVFDFPYATPTLDGVVLTEQPFATAAPAASAHVPLLVGTCRDEQATGRAHPEIVTMTAPELRAHLLPDYGARTDAVIAAFRRAYPADAPYATLGAIEGMAPRRPWAVQHARLKAAQAIAPAFLFEFAWRTPVLDAAPLAHHGADLAFALCNVDRCANATSGNAEARRMAEMMSDAWIAFIRTGDPNHPGLPHWPAVTTGALPTMIFDRECAVAVDHDRELRELATVVPDSLRHL